MDIGPCASLHKSTLLMQYVLYQNTHITMHSKTVCLGKSQDIIQINWKTIKYLEDRGEFITRGLSAVLDSAILSS